jgi:transcription elongation factor S-II
VGKLRTHASKDVSDLAKELVKKWKNEVEKAKQQNGASPPTMKKASSSVTAKSPSTTVSTPSSTPKAEQRTAKSDGAKGATGDTTRDKCTEVIYDALAFDSSHPTALVEKRARAVEASVYREFGSTGQPYKAKIRSLFVNLKDKNNPGLRENVVNGDLPAEKLATMSSSDMASEERKAADSKIEAENFFRSLGAEEQAAETDAFQCGRCKQRKCRYRQQQTRSADEPMTTFVTCTNCGNRWKFC